MMATVINYFVILIFVVALFTTNQTATKLNKNTILGVTLPYHILKNKDVMEIVKSYKKSYSVLILIFIILSLPMLIFKNSPSFTMIYTFTWIILLLCLNNKTYIKHFKVLYSLKRKNDWFLENKQVITVDTEVSRIKNKMPVPWLWFIPSFIICIIPFIITITVENNPNVSEIFLSLLSVPAIAFFYWLYRLYSSEKTVVYNEKTEVNLACNFIHKRLWSLCWVVIATVTSMLHLLQYLNLQWKDNYSLPITLFLYILIFLVCVFYTYNKIRSTQSRLLEASLDVIYTDDDEFWARGYYYNPNDRRTMVEKRIGYGFTCNMATLKGKCLTFGILVPVAVLILFLSIVFVRMDTGSFNLFINGSTVKIEAPLYAFSFDINEIQEVNKIDVLPKGARTNGAATEVYNLGNFNLNGYGNSRMYVYKENPPFIIVKLKDIYLFINGKTKETTDKYYKILIESTK